MHQGVPLRTLGPGPGKTVLSANWGTLCTPIIDGPGPGLQRDRDPIGDEVLRVDEPVIAVCIGRTSGGRRSMAVVARTRKKKRAVRCEAVGAVEPGAEAVLMIVAAVAFRKETVLDAVNLVGTCEHVTVGRIQVVGEAVDVMVPAGF